jgi:hypothetical protein
MQPTFVPGTMKTMTGTNDVNQWRFVGGDGNQCGAGARSYGVSMMEAVAGNPYTAIISGESLVELGAAANAGDEVESDANGCAIPLNTGKANGVISVSGTTGDLVPVCVK